MGSVQVTFHPGGAAVSVPAGATVLEAAGRAGLRLETPCGGQGRCGKCMVRVSGGVSAPSGAEISVLGKAEIARGWRLACEARLVGEAEVRVPDSSLIAEHRVVVEGVGREVVVEPSVRKLALRLPSPSLDDPRADLTRLLEALGGRVAAAPGPELLRQLPAAVRYPGNQVTAVLVDDELVAVEAGDTAEACYGVAVDIGTTTVVAYLCHLPTGKVVGVASDLNPQAQYGGDVISRLQAAVSQERGLAQLQGAIVGLLNELIEGVARRAGVSARTIYEVVAVGNTCMMHFLLGVPPQGLAGVPFTPAFRRSQRVRAVELGLGIAPAGRVYVAPSIGGYVGADTVGVILASELDAGDGLCIAVDIGTNGEIVVGRRQDLYACSTAAGPAFEGARISRGMGAAAGAIDAVTVDGDIGYHVIGDVPARGICGSGLVDAVAALVEMGVVDEGGRLREPEEVESAPEKVRRRVRRNGGGLEFVLVPAEEAQGGKPVAISARDVRELQLAKGAICAGISLMLSRLGAETDEVEALLLAGAFGNYIRRESAIAIGLVPALDAGRIVSIGNAAGVGARLMLCSRSLRRRGEEIAERVEHVELSEQPGFYDHFAQAMALRPRPRVAG